MPYVCKQDGAIQCESHSGLTLTEAYEELVNLIGKKHILDSGHTHKDLVPALCGFRSGVYHHFEVTSEGAFLLEKGFLGNGGFEPCGPDRPKPIEGGASNIFQDDVTLGNVIRISHATSVKKQPVLIRELLGRIVRCYFEGDVLTQDYIPDRVNIKRSRVNNTIMEIWFG